ncbi:MAG: AAA family ATPase [Gammaproteobacteria bacterium]|nr:AAA family ATPase [Gammaproteobacteria bacterium]
MYEEFYKFTGKPFQLNPDPSFFFQSAGHQRAMSYLRYGLQQGQGFIIVTGDVGTGKTMLVNNLFRELEARDAGIVAAKIVSTNINESDLLRIVCSEFDLPYERVSKASLLKQLEVFFKSCVDEGKRVLLVVDEAQNLPRSSLEELRMLSNFDYKGMPVVQSFLLGQREFRAIMRSPGLEQLRQRVLAAYHLKPLSPPETETYIKHRLSKVGWTLDPELEHDVYLGVYQFTSGVPRRINTLMDRLLLNASLEESHKISYKNLRQITAEITNEQDAGEDSDDVVGSPSIPATPMSIPEKTSPAATRTSVVTEADEAQNVEIRKLKAQLTAMQRAFDNLSGDLTRRGMEPGNDASMPPKLGAGSALRWWMVAAVGALFGLGVAAAIHYFK